MVDSIRLFRGAQRVVCALPEAAGRALFSMLGTAIGVSGSAGVRQLRRNLGRVLDAGASGTSGRASVGLACSAMRSYMRYYYECFRLPAMSEAQVRARVRIVNAEAIRGEFREGRAAIGALVHAGNWDMAGAWAELELAHVHTLAEKLEPEELYDFFVSFRESLGMHVYPAGSGAIHTLEAAANSEACLVPILADRDLTVSGVETPFCGHMMMVAAGPALLAQRTGCLIFPIFSHYERLSGTRSRVAGCRWGTVLTVGEPIAARTTRESSPEERRDDIARMSHEWIAQCEPWVRQHPQDWHMLQKVFVEDLDPERLARARARAAEAVVSERNVSDGMLSPQTTAQEEA